MNLERREQVFVSSTYTDLQDERQEVIQTLLEADCIPSGMELFPASSDDQWSLIKRVIDDCDYYVVLIGGRYGSVNAERDLSYTEMEYDYAIEAGLPVMGFLHAEPESIAGGKSELDPESRARLADFRAKVETRMVKYWTNPQELAGHVAKSLIQLRKTHPAEGWVRASGALTPETAQELSELRATVIELSTALHAANEANSAMEDLEQGSDRYEFGCILKYFSLKQTQTAITQRTRPKQHFFSLPATWDQIFAFTGPSMMDEISEHDLSDKLDSLAVELWLAESPAPPADLGRELSVTAWEEALDDIKVQLFALDLITQSERRRAVSDKNSYWTLTTRGREHLMRLRARRRKPIKDLETEPPPPLDKS